MAEGEASLGRVVQTIMESLSEAISQLMLYVIAMQESNSQVPTHIPQAAQGVTSASNTLAEVANSIAEDEYDGYPEIQTPIIEAAKDVRESGAQLLQAISNLQNTNNRSEGWARLLDACRVISAQTCYILQLVYEAELRVMSLAAEAAKKLSDETPAALAAKDPAKFAAQVGELAGMADALAENILSKIAEEESPLRQEEMRAQAKKLKELAELLPALANKILAKPSDINNHAPYNNKLKELAKVLADVTNPIQQKLELMPDRPPKVNTQPKPAPGPGPQRTNDPPFRPVDPPFHSQTANVPPDPDHPPPPIPLQAVKAAKDDVKRLLAAANSKDSQALGKEAQHLPVSVSPLVEALEQQAKASFDPQRVEQLQKTAEELKRIVPKIITVGAQALKDPAVGSPQLQKMQQQFDTLADYAQQVCAPANAVQVAALAKELLRELPKLKEPPLVEPASKKLGNLLPFMKLPTKDLIANTTHPKTKERLTEALRSIENAIPEAINTAKASAKNARDEPTKQKLEKALQVAEAALKDIIHGCGTDVLAHARKQNDDLGRLDVHATLEQPAQVSSVQKAIAARQPELAQQALEYAATSPDNNAKEDVAKNVARLDALLPEEIKAAHEVVKKPTADEPKKKLKQSNQEMAKALNNVAATLAKIPPPATTPSAAVTPSLQDLVDAIQAAKDPKGEETLKKILDKVAPALQKIVDEIDEEEARANHVNDLGLTICALLNRVAALATSEKPPNIKTEIEELQKIIPAIVQAAAPFAEDDPLLKDALGDLAALLPGFVSLAEDVAKNPRGPRDKKLQDKKDDLAKNVKFVINRVKPPEPTGDAPGIRKFRKGVKKILDVIDDPGIDFSKLLENLKKVIQDPKQTPPENKPDYLGKRKIAEAIAKLEQQLQDKNAKPPPQVVNGKPYQEAKKAFQDAVAALPKPTADPYVQAKEVEAILDRLDALASSPTTDPHKFNNLAKALDAGVAPLIQSVKKGIEGIKDPEQRKKVAAALQNLEKELPKIKAAVNPTTKDPNPENKQKLKDAIQELKNAAPLEQIIGAFAPNPAVDLGNTAKQEAQRLKNAVRRNDPKAATDALKNIKDLGDKLAKIAKEKSTTVPPKARDNIEQSAKEVYDAVQALEPVVLQFAKKPTDGPLKENVDQLAGALAPTIDQLVQNLEFAAHAAKAEQEEIAKQILAALKQKNIKKLDPSNLLKISKHLAGLLSDMVSKTGAELHNMASSELSDRARAALELEKLLASLDKDANANRTPDANTSQNIEALMSSLNLGATMGSGSSAGGQTHLSQEISSVAKQIRTKTSGSIEGTPLYSISQGLATDLQKFADADSGNSRSELIVLGRAISANIVRLADELKRLAASCKDPKLQEKLLMNAQVLRNYSTQLKIMASVRAASPKSSRDSSSDQLVILSQNLAVVISDATNAVSIIKQTNRGAM